jgi:hypothetical protein
MAEESESGGSLKSILIGLASTVAIAVGGFVTKQLTGEEETKVEAPATTAQQPQIVINNAQTQQQQAGGGKTVIIKEKATEPAKEKPKPKTAKEELEEAPKW